MSSGVNFASDFVSPVKRYISPEYKVIPNENIYMKMSHVFFKYGINMLINNIYILRLVILCENFVSALYIFNKTIGIRMITRQKINVRKTHVLHMRMVSCMASIKLYVSCFSKLYKMQIILRLKRDEIY